MGMTHNKLVQETSSVGGRELFERLNAVGAFDDLFAAIDSGKVELTGPDGFFQALVKAGLERGLQAELDAHLGYGKHEAAGRGSGNSRNGTSRKTVACTVGDIALDIPRDRAGTFNPRLVPKGKRRLDGLDGMIISLYAGGMTVRDIQQHLALTIGSDLSRETISTITDAVLEEMSEWQNRPLDEFYPVIFFDAIRIKIRDSHQVINKVAHIAIGVDLDGVKRVLGIWINTNEGASFWASVCAELANRGVKDVLIVAVDGLSGLPEAIEATWDGAIVQTCVVHLIRASNRFVSYADRKAVSSALRKIYTAVNEETAKKALDDFEASELGRQYPSAVKTWRNAWERFTPFLAFPPALRKVIYTTNAIESLNYQLRKVTKNRGHFPSDEAAVKLLWLAITNIEDKRARERSKAIQQGKKTNHLKSGKIVEGQATIGWSKALNQLARAYPDRFNKYQ